MLGKALVGAIIGAAVGIVLLLVAYRFFEMTDVWLALPFAFVTGLGVRLLGNTPGRSSYVRGALTMVIALAAYLGGGRLVAQVATSRANAPIEKKVTPPADASADKSDGETAEEATDEPQDAAPAAAQAPTAAPGPVFAKPQMQRAFSTWDFIWLCAAALCAYIMGSEGGRAAAGGMAGQAGEASPMGTHPDA